MIEEYAKRELIKIDKLRKEVQQFSVPLHQQIASLVLAVTLCAVFLFQSLYLGVLFLAVFTIFAFLQAQINALRRQNKVLTYLLEEVIEDRLKLYIPNTLKEKKESN